MEDEHKAVSTTRVTVQYSFLQGMFWMSFCIIFSFSSVYLLDKDFSSTQIGILVAAAGILSAVLQPLTAGFADRSERFSVRAIIAVVSLIIVFFSIILLFAGRNMLLTGLMYGLIITFLQVLTPLVNSLGMNCINRGIGINFGIARGVGSFSYAAISYLGGMLIERYQTIVVPILIIMISILFLISVFLFRYEKGDLMPVKIKMKCPEESEQPEEASFFRRYKSFGLLIGGCTLVFVAHNMINNYIYQIIITKGGGSAEMGLTMGIAAVCEIPTMFLFAWLVKKIRCSIWLKISGVFFVLKSLGTLLARDVNEMYVVQITQMLGFALFAIASIYYVNAIMKEKDRIQGQAYMAVTNTLGSVLGSSFGGAIIDMGGAQAMVEVSIGIAFVGMIIIWAVTKKI